MCAGGYCVEVTDANGCITNSGVTELISTSGFVTLSVSVRDLGVNPVTIDLLYQIGVGSTFSLVAGTTFNNSCQSNVGSITGLTNGDTVTFSTDNTAPINGQSGTGNCPAFAGSNGLYTYTITQSSGTEGVSLTIDTDSPL